MVLLRLQGAPAQLDSYLLQLLTLSAQMRKKETFSGKRYYMELYSYLTHCLTYNQKLSDRKGHVTNNLKEKEIINIDSNNPDTVNID